MAKVKSGIVTSMNPGRLDPEQVLEVAPLEDEDEQAVGGAETEDEEAAEDDEQEQERGAEHGDEDEREGVGDRLVEVAQLGRGAVVRRWRRPEHCPDLRRDDCGARRFGDV
jgi:hypothetical protein